MAHAKPLPENVSLVGDTFTKSGHLRKCYQVTCLFCGVSRNITRRDHAVRLSTHRCKTCSNRSNHPQGEIRGIRVSWFNKFKLGASHRSIDWNLSAEEVGALLTQQEGKCALSGIPIIASGDFKDITASIDRIDSAKGYHLGNIQLVHKDINMMKQSFSQEYFIDLCKKVARKKNQ